MDFRPSEKYPFGVIITEDLIGRIEGSEARRLMECARAGGFESFSVAGGAAAFCGDGNPMTQCSGVGSRGEVSVEVFEQILSLYRGRAELFEFKLSPISPQDLREWVVSRGRAVPEFETILVQSLAAMAPAEVHEDIREVSAAGARDYAERSGRWFFGDGDLPPGLVEIITASCVGPAVRTFEGFSEGQPVAGCSVNFAEGVAWLAGAAVDPAHRGQGWHKTMQAFRVRLAQRLGCDLVCQGALPGSISQQNAQKSGFSIAFTRPTIMVDPS